MSPKALQSQSSIALKLTRILLIDNYDSFTYNLYQYLGEVLTDRGGECHLNVVRNDHITLKQIQEQTYTHIILSPGPGDPSDRAYFGVCADVLTQITDTPILGVCLGMQGIAHYFGGKVTKAQKPMHGKTSPITHDNQGVFQDIPQHIEVMRYHSLIADHATLPDTLEITATTTDSPNEIMGLRHKTLPIEGIQFHPESFATQAGKHMLSNFIYNTYEVQYCSFPTINEDKGKQ